MQEQAVCKHGSLSNIAPNFYFERLKETFAPLQKVQLDSCDDSIQLFRLGVLSRALSSRARVHSIVSPRHTELSRVLFWRNKTFSLGDVLASVRSSFSSSCQCHWRWASLTAVGSTREVVLCGAADSKQLTLTEKSSLFNDGESLCAAMLPSSDRQQRHWRDDVTALAGSEWWRERRHLGSFPFFPLFYLLTLWKTRMAPCYGTMYFIVYIFNAIFKKQKNKNNGVCMLTPRQQLSLKQKRETFAVVIQWQMLAFVLPCYRVNWTQYVSYITKILLTTCCFAVCQMIC